MKVLFLAKSPDATEYFRVTVPQKFLEREGVEVRRSYLDPVRDIPDSGIKRHDVLWADIIVLQRPLTEFALGCIQEIKRAHPEKVLIGEYDDDYYSVPKWNPGFTFVKATQPFWSQIPQYYDGIITSTLPLADAFAKVFDGPIDVIENGFDFEMFDSVQPLDKHVIHAPRVNPEDPSKLEHVYPITVEQFNELMRDKTVVCWAGSRFHYVDLDWLVDDIPTILEKDPNIVFLFVGYIQGNIVKQFPLNRLFISGGRSPIQGFYSLLKSFKIDITLAPLDPCVFNRSKSNLKILEAHALGAYPICSDLQPYENDLDPGAVTWEGYEYLPRHGDLCDYSMGSWSRAILNAAERLRDPEVKDFIRRDNDVYVRERHHASKRTHEYIRFFEKLLKNKEKK